MIMYLRPSIQPQNIFNHLFTRKLGHDHKNKHSKKKKKNKQLSLRSSCFIHPLPVSNAMSTSIKFGNFDK